MTSDDVGSDRPGRSVDRQQQTVEATVEAELRRRVEAELGGLRGSLEMALPLVVFTIVHVVGGELRASLVAGGVASLVTYAVRVVQGSITRYVPATD